MSRLRAFLLIVPAVLCQANAGERRPIDAVMIKQSPVQDAPGDSGAAAERLIGEGNVVRVLESRDGWTRVETDVGGMGWVAGNTLAPVSQFRRVSTWTQPRRAEVGDGDYSAIYRFGFDGRFEVSETAQSADESYRSVMRRGILYVYGAVIWARVGNERPNSSRMFLRKGKTLCWQGYLDGRCP